MSKLSVDGLAKKAFDLYYFLGEDRSLIQLQAILPEKLGIQRSEICLKKWSAKYKWVEKIKERDKKVRAEVEKKIDDPLVQQKEKYINMIHGILLNSTKLIDREDNTGEKIINPSTGKPEQIRVSKIIPKNVREVVELIRAEMFLREGEKSEIDHNIKGDLAWWRDHAIKAVKKESKKV